LVAAVIQADAAVLVPDVDAVLAEVFLLPPPPPLLPQAVRQSAATTAAAIHAPKARAVGLVDGAWSERDI
jgi:hypothetical protein